jgi:hypothetical protein
LAGLVLDELNANLMKGQKMFENVTLAAVQFGNIFAAALGYTAKRAMVCDS